MASPIKNVVLIGAGGNLGPSILKEFLASSLNVTVLSRPESKSTFSSEVKVVKSDYSSDSLKSAFAGQDAVVSIVGTPGFAAQQVIIDAAIAAGVKRFIPSEFGSNTSSADVVSLVPFLGGKAKVVEYLKTKESSISWSGLITGPFFDWGLKVGFLGFNLAEKKATLWDGGEAEFAVSNLSTIGKALVALLSSGTAFDKSKNEYVYIASHVVNQKQVLASLEKATGSKWTVAGDVDVDARVKETNEKLAKGDFSSATDLILAATFGKKKQLGTFPKYWNDELGLPKEDLDERVKETVDGKRP
ncbi:NmrA-like protein [Neofusicoccum parvum]|uniref:NmrA-like protein n=1 Tax=Neofusicoccum parvum TaxID=310453 RepID=A0ACB5SEN5_9PEZI|nr:NmrA-like protein [Neofusicoccum parvum]GME37534.1 NmrA-like protein [Neofusicoccum parvum]